MDTNKKKEKTTKSNYRIITFVKQGSKDGLNTKDSISEKIKQSKMAKKKEE